MRVLGIETSCDETAASVVTSDKTILSNVVFSQLEEHAPYLGVVPEIAARSHAEHLNGVIEAAMREAKLGFSELDAVAATCGPGLIGGVIVGAMMGKAIASVCNKPFIAVNHLEGHALSARLVDDVAFPFLLLLVSGGHCQLLIVHGVGKYRKLGGTLDDALGEAFDKTAKMLELGYPGGPAVEALAKQGNPERFKFTVPLKGRAGCDFSFSGLKTSVRQAVQEQVRAEQDKADICASFQRVVGETLSERLAHAIEIYRQDVPSGGALVVAGGVAANAYIRASLQDIADGSGLSLHVPPPKLCTDNAAMIAWAGIENLRENKASSLDVEPRARWSLTE